MSKVPRYSVTSSLLKVLVSLKALHGGKSGAKGATLEEISMHMVKQFNIDGDIKSQVLSSLKYGVKLNLIEKRKEKFILIIPGSGVHLATCKQKMEEAERMMCIYPPQFPPSCGTGSCAPAHTLSCCGRRRSKRKSDLLACGRKEEPKQTSCCCCQPPPPPPKKIKHRPCPAPTRCAFKKSKCGNQPCGDIFNTKPEYCTADTPMCELENRCYKEDYNDIMEGDDDEDDFMPAYKNCRCNCSK